MQIAHPLSDIKRSSLSSCIVILLAGLSLMLNIEKYHYLKYGSSDLAPAQWVGAVVKVHPPDQAPLAEIGDVDVQPNTKTKIVVKRVSSFSNATKHALLLIVLHKKRPQ